MEVDGVVEGVMDGVLNDKAGRSGFGGCDEEALNAA